MDGGQAPTPEGRAIPPREGGRDVHFGALEREGLGMSVGRLRGGGIHLVFGSTQYILRPRAGPED